MGKSSTCSAAFTGDEEPSVRRKGEVSGGAGDEINSIPEVSKLDSCGQEEDEEDEADAEEDDKVVDVVDSDGNNA